MNAHPTTCLCCLSLDRLGVPDSVQIKKIKRLKNECSLFILFLVHFYHLFSGPFVKHVPSLF